MAYIDTEYILENISEYNDISNQLEKKQINGKMKLKKNQKKLKL